MSSSPVRRSSRKNASSPDKAEKPLEKRSKHQGEQAPSQISMVAHLEEVQRDAERVDLQECLEEDEELHDHDDFEEFGAEDGELEMENVDVAELDGRKSRHKPKPRPWTIEEEEKLRDLVVKNQEKNWKKIAIFFPDRTHAQCMQHWKQALNPRVGKGNWTPKEDAKLTQLVQKYGRKWSVVAQCLPRRTGKRCRERYLNHLDPNVKKNPLSEEEKEILLQANKELGNRWSEIQKQLPGRSVNTIKNFWYSHSRAQARLSVIKDPELPLSKRPKTEKEHRPWTIHEAEMLRALVEQYGPKKWLFIASHIPGRSDLQCMQHWMHVMNPKVIKGKGSWTSEEDEILIERVSVLGRKWAKIAEFLPGRIGKQCRERFVTHLDPSLKKTPWTFEEDAILADLHPQHYNRWAQISKHIPGRSDNDVKNRWYQAHVGGQFKDQTIEYYHAVSSSFKAETKLESFVEAAAASGDTAEEQKAAASAASQSTYSNVEVI